MRNFKGFGTLVIEVVADLISVDIACRCKDTATRLRQSESLQDTEAERLALGENRSLGKNRSAQSNRNADMSAWHRALTRHTKRSSMLVLS